MIHTAVACCTNIARTSVLCISMTREGSQSDKSFFPNFNEVSSQVIRGTASSLKLNLMIAMTMGFPMTVRYHALSAGTFYKDNTKCVIKHLNQGRWQQQYLREYLSHKTCQFVVTVSVCAYKSDRRSRGQYQKWQVKHPIYGSSRSGGQLHPFSLQLQHLPLLSSSPSRPPLTCLGQSHPSSPSVGPWT